MLEFFSVEDVGQVDLLILPIYSFSFLIQDWVWNPRPHNCKQIHPKYNLFTFCFCFVSTFTLHIQPPKEISPVVSWSLTVIPCLPFWLSVANQCDRIGWFLKYQGDYFLTKVAQRFCDFLGYFEKHNFLSKNCCGYFWSTFSQIWATFISNRWLVPQLPALKREHCLIRQFFINKYINNSSTNYSINKSWFQFLS